MSVQDDIREQELCIYKRQWKLAQYQETMDLESGYSPKRMLEILRSRLAYIARRGATLNNPHIPKGFLAKFDDQHIHKEHAAEIRQKFQAYLKSKEKLSYES